MIPLLTAEQMRRMDAHTIQVVGLPGAVLMETAGRGVVRHLCEQFPGALGAVAVLCGRGNNGGDGLVVARCLHNRGVPVAAYLLGGSEGLAVGGAPRLHLDALRGCGGRVVEVTHPEPAIGATVAGASLVVDAVFGTGLTREVAGLAGTALGWIEDSPAPVVSVDLPSGVCADSGCIRGRVVTAELTVTFGFPKRGHYLYPGAARCGRVEVVDIGLPGDILDVVPADLFLGGAADGAPPPAPAADAHKGICGHVAVLGGSPGTAGAPGLAAWAALRSGAGLATVAWPRGLEGTGRLPLELMTLPLDGAGPRQEQWDPSCWPAIARLLERAAAAVVGPGLGSGSGAAAVLDRVLATAAVPLVLDADALNLLAAASCRPGDAGAGRVLTPHPGEAARLLGTDTAAVQADRPAAAEALARRFGAVVVLKGAGTLVAAPGAATCLFPVGNPGMATAGSGDVLAGVVGALLARGLGPLDAARTGVRVHGAAGDRAAVRLGPAGMTAGDLLDEVPAVLRTRLEATPQRRRHGAQEEPCTAPLATS